MPGSSDPFRVVALNGSLRRGSIHAGLLREAEAALGERAELSLPALGTLPFYNSDLESDLPRGVADFLAGLRAAEGVIIAAPEYNMSFTGVLKNALEWASRSALGAPMKNKPVALMGASPLPIGTGQGQSHLRQVLFGLQVDLVRRPLVMIGMAGEKFDAAGRLHHEETRSLVRQLIEALVAAMTARRSAGRS